MHRWDESHYRQEAKRLYGVLSTRQSKRYRWLRIDVFKKNLVTHLRQDARALHSILANAGEIPPAKDFKLQALIRLLESDFPGEKGLGQPSAGRDPDFQELIGQIPYLNGGIFEEHRIEREHPDLYIPDEAFDSVFGFLDGYDWHLDDRPISSGKEINPEILGYVFEKYTNQKEMGAYYTKEDITDYIAKNCIIPFLLDAAGDKLGDGAWNLLRDDPDRYIYPAVGHGVFCDYPTGEKLSAPLPLPDYIEKGIDTTEPELRKRRARWNESATPDLGLPTEIWRETVARRQRCQELQRKLRAGEVRAVNDLITLNLNIRQFAQDVVENAGPTCSSRSLKPSAKSPCSIPLAAPARSSSPH